MSRPATSIPRDFISQTPDVCGGAPVISGTRIRVSHIAFRYDRKRQSPAEIVRAYPHLTLADVHAALAYYYSHQEAIDKEIASSDDVLLKAKEAYPSKLPRQSKQ